MKAIKEGVNPNIHIWQGTCSNCKGIYQATRLELLAEGVGTIHEPITQRDDEYIVHPCPCCKEPTYFYELRNTDERFK